MKRSCFRVLNPRAGLLTNTISSYQNRNIHKINTDSNNSNHENVSKISTLYVPGRYGGNVYQIVKPEIDVKYIESNLSTIDKSCHIRGIKLDLQYILNILKEWSCKQHEHLKIVEKFHEYEDDAKRLESLNLNEESKSVKQESLKCVEKMKLIKENLYDIEDIVMPLVQKIPNIIDNFTPMESDDIKVLDPFPSNNFKSIPHIELAKSKSLLDFSSLNPPTYYLEGPLAEIEIAAQDYFSNKFRSFKFVPLSCVDFCKSFILEAVGLNPYSCDHCIPLKNNKSLSETGQKLNIVGGASLESFCAYLINMNIDLSILPSKYFSMGRHYEAGNRQSRIPSLFSVVQSSRVHCIVLSEPSTESLEFDSLFDIFLSCYIPFNVPLRAVDIAAPRLNITESRRKQVEIWSAAEQRYIPVAHVSQRNDFISKRLQITFGVQHNIQGFCCIIEGAAVNIPVLLGCLLEHYQKPDGTINFNDIFEIFNKCN